LKADNIIFIAENCTIFFAGVLHVVIKRAFRSKVWDV